MSVPTSTSLRETITHDDQHSGLFAFDVNTTGSASIPSGHSSGDVTGLSPRGLIKQGPLQPASMSSQDLTQSDGPLAGAVAHPHGSCVPTLTSPSGTLAMAPLGLSTDTSGSFEALRRPTKGSRLRVTATSHVDSSEGAGGTPVEVLADSPVRPQSTSREEHEVSCPGLSDGSRRLAPTSLVNNEACHTATYRASDCAEPPRTGEDRLTADDADPVTIDISGDGPAHVSTPSSPPTTHDSTKKSKSKAKDAPKATKHRDLGGHAVADDDIARCEELANKFYASPDDMDAFIDSILFMPKNQVFELTIPLGEGYRNWSEKVICNQFVKENPGSLWGSKFRNILIHKKNPVTMVISCYDVATCSAIGGTTFKLGSKEFLIPKYSQYAKNYFITFTKVNNPALARAIVKELTTLTKSVIAAFNPTADQSVASPHLRVIFQSSSPPVALVPSSGPAMREVVVRDPSGHEVAMVFQHKLAVFNKHVPPSVLARQGKPRSNATPSTSPQPRQAETQAPNPAPVASPAQVPRRPVNGTTPPPTLPRATPASLDPVSDIEDEDMEAPALPLTPRGELVDQDMDDAPPSDFAFSPNDTPTANSTTIEPGTAQTHEHPTELSLELVSVTGSRSAPGPKRPLSLSPRSPAPLSTSNRFTILQEDDLELSVDDVVVPRLVLEDSDHPRVKTKAKKQKPNKSKHAHLERALKTIKQDAKGIQLDACQRILQSEPQVVAHSMYSHQGDTSLFTSLAATRAIERTMAAFKQLGQSDDYRQHVPFYTLSAAVPHHILTALKDDRDLNQVRCALGTMDLFLTNRAPDLYNNSEALTSLLGDSLSRWDSNNALTDRALWHLVVILHDALNDMTLPSPVQLALTQLVTISTHYPIDALCDNTDFTLRSTLPWADIVGMN